MALWEVNRHNYAELKTVKVSGSNIIENKIWVGLVSPTYSGSDAHAFSSKSKEKQMYFT